MHLTRRSRPLTFVRWTASVGACFAFSRRLSLPLSSALCDFMRCQVKKSIFSHIIYIDGKKYRYVTKFFSRTNCLINADNEVVVTMKCNSWFKYSYDIQTPNGNYKFIWKTGTSELISTESGDKFYIPIGTMFFYGMQHNLITKIQKSREESGKYDLEIFNDQHAMALLIVTCSFLGMPAYLSGGYH